MRMQMTSAERKQSLWPRDYHKYLQLRHYAMEEYYDDVCNGHDYDDVNVDDGVDHEIWQ